MMNYFFSALVYWIFSLWSIHLSSIVVKSKSKSSVRNSFCNCYCWWVLCWVIRNKFSINPNYFDLSTSLCFQKWFNYISTSKYTFSGCVRNRVNKSKMSVPTTGLSKLKKKHIRVKHQKVKLFRANEPLLSVFMWGVNHTVIVLIIIHLRIISTYVWNYIVCDKVVLDRLFIINSSLLLLIWVIPQLSSSTIYLICWVYHRIWRKCTRT